MQPRLLIAISIFVGSYLPLSLILLTQDLNYDILSTAFSGGWQSFLTICEIPLQNPKASIAFFLICLLCLVITVFALRWIRPRHEIQISEAKHIPTDLMNYVLPYVVSFMSLSYQDQSKLFGFAIFLAWLFWISQASGRIIFNPVLIVLRWRLYEVKYTFGGSTKVMTGFALSRCTLSPQSRYLMETMQEVLIIKEQRH